ncbi:MAG: oxaloacetate decarboxylase [Candidatus Latescibacterota bacterium]
MNAARRFRELLAAPGPIIAPGVYDCVSAKVTERAGFSAAFISGGAVTASVLGYPDVGLQTMPEFLGQARNMARCVDIPLLVDVDTGFGNALNVMRTVREFESAGLAGIFFEDQTFPKRCGHFEGKKAIPVEEMVVKVKAAVEARRSDDFVIIARTDTRAIYGIDHAIERSLAYVEAGADLIFVEAMLSEEEMRKVTSAIHVPLQANLSEQSKTPILPVHKLYEMGFKLISYSGLLQRTAIRSMFNVLDVLKKEGSTMSAFPSQICSLIERSELLGLQQFYEIEERLYGPLIDTEGSWRTSLADKAKVTGSNRIRKLPI